MVDSCLPILTLEYLCIGVLSGKYGQEESPGCSKAGFHLTDGWGNPRASATESRPPKAGSDLKSFVVKQ